MIECPRCGKENRNGARFCVQCGGTLNEDAGSSTVASLAGGPGGVDTAFTEAALVAPPGTAKVIPQNFDMVEGQTEFDEPARATEGANALVGEPAPYAPAPGIDTSETRLTQAEDILESGERSEQGPATAGDPFPSLPVTIAGRYTLIRVIEQNEDSITYQAQDWGHCWQCHAVRENVQETYCEKCGIEVDHGVACQAQTGGNCSDSSADCVTLENGVVLWVSTDLSEPEPVTFDHKGLCLRVGYASHPGQVREIDEDSVLVLTGLTLIEGQATPNLGLFAIADGMGGHDDGQEASKRVVQVIAEELLQGLFMPAFGGEVVLSETLETRIQSAVEEANRRLVFQAHEYHSDMGSTLTLALILNNKAFIANVGDSRTYLWRNGILEQLTRDHSAVARLVEKGMLARDEIYTHPRRSDIYRMMGNKLDLEVDLVARELLPGDRVVLCCDGVWETVRDDGIERILFAYPADPQAACNEIVEQANLSGGEDNISVIVVDILPHVSASGM